MAFNNVTEGGSETNSDQMDAGEIGLLSNGYYVMKTDAGTLLNLGTGKLLSAARPVTTKQSITITKGGIAA